MGDRIIWTDEMVAAVDTLRAEGDAVNVIAEKLGVSREAFQRWRQLSGYAIAPISRSKHTLVGWDMSVHQRVPRRGLQQRHHR